jgi:hypothetical protein
MAERDFYHLTTKRNLASILKSGLIPRRGPRSRGHRQDEAREAVYLFLEMWNALQVLDDMYGDKFAEELVLLRVRLEESRVQMEGAEGQAVSLTKVPPSALEVVTVGLWGESYLGEQEKLAGEASRLRYHVTPARNLKRIFKEGLRARRGARSRKLQEGKAIFLFPTRQAAEEAAANWLGDEFAEGTRLALLKVLVPSDAEIVFDPGVGYESLVTTDVGAENLSVVSDNF